MMIRPAAYFLAFMAGPPAFAAGAGEVTIGTQAGRSDAPRGEDAWWWGGWASLGLDDALSLIVSGSTATHALPRVQPTDPESLTTTSVAGGFRYDLDILDVAPFLGLQVGGISHRDAGGPAEWDSLLVISVGVDWVVWKGASLGIAAHWYQALLRGDGGLFRFGPRLAWRWR